MPCAFPVPPDLEMTTESVLAKSLSILQSARQTVGIRVVTEMGLHGRLPGVTSASVMSWGQGRSADADDQQVVNLRPFPE